MNIKQLRFCEEYLIDLNATQAAIRAGYSEKTAYSQGDRLLKDVEIQEKIKVLQNERAERTRVKADDVLNELAVIGFSNITNFLKVDDVTVTGKHRNGRRYKKKVRTIEIFKTSDIPADKIGAVSEVRMTKDGISIKLHDKVKALENIARHLGMFKDKLDLTSNGENISLDKLSKDELKSLLQLQEKVGK